jgi:hypothetical protein
MNNNFACAEVNKSTTFLTRTSSEIASIGHGHRGGGAKNANPKTEDKRTGQTTEK